MPRKPKKSLTQRQFDNKIKKYSLIVPMVICIITSATTMLVSRFSKPAPSFFVLNTDRLQSPRAHLESPVADPIGLSQSSLASPPLGQGQTEPEEREDSLASEESQKRQGGGDEALEEKKDSAKKSKLVLVQRNHRNAELYIMGRLEAVADLTYEIHEWVVSPEHVFLYKDSAIIVPEDEVVGVTPGYQYLDDLQLSQGYSDLYQLDSLVIEARAPYFPAAEDAGYNYLAVLAALGLLIPLCIALDGSLRRLLSRFVSLRYDVSVATEKQKKVGSRDV